MTAPNANQTPVMDQFMPHNKPNDEPSPLASLADKDEWRPITGCGLILSFEITLFTAGGDEDFRNCM